MTVTASALRELHRIHRQMTDLRERLERGPKQVAAAQGSVNRIQKELQEAKEAAQRARIVADEKQMQLKGREDKIGDLKARLNAASSNKEYQALKEQIAADEQANLVMQDEILEALERLDEWTAKVGVIEQNLAKAKEDAAKTKERVDGERAKLESEFSRVQGELKQAEAALPADFKADYARVAAIRGEAALAQVDGEFCGGCYQRITPQMMNELYMSKPVFCKSCGCLLYLAEDRGVGGE